MRFGIKAGLLTASALSAGMALGLAAAQAQEAPAADPAAEAPLTQEEAEAQVLMMQAQIEAMQKQIAAMQEKVAKQEKATTWRGAPRSSGDGFTFKVRGRMQYDAFLVTDSDNVVNTKDLGFQSYFRRVRLGVEGALPGDFKYKAEFDFSNNTVGYGDVLLEYAPKGKPYSIKLGNMETNYSLEQMTSSRFITFIERAQMTEAFYTGRRLGASVGFKQGDFRIDLGLFNTPINSARNLDEWLFGTRVVYNPKMGDTQLHLGASYQHREFNTNDLSFRYRSRPFARSTDFRFVDTGALAANKDDSFALELAAINGPLHAAAEYQMVKTKVINPADVLTDGDATTGTRLGENPTFSSGYVEIGYFLTGETRGYKTDEATWDRTKVANPVDKGGAGAWSINARIDFLDLDDSVTNGAGIQYINGGKQTGYGLSVNWMPIDYVRFIAQYIYTDVSKVAFTTATPAFGSSRIGARVSSTVNGTDSLNSNVFGLRAQFDW
jgi:phosphate-selective porin OprO and OprP